MKLFESIELNWFKPWNGRIEPKSKYETIRLETKSRRILPLTYTTKYDLT